VSLSGLGQQSPCASGPNILRQLPGPITPLERGAWRLLIPFAMTSNSDGTFDSDRAIHSATISVIDRLMLARPADLDEVSLEPFFDAASPCHLYFIARRPRISIDPSGCSFNASAVRYRFRVHTDPPSMLEVEAPVGKLQLPAQLKALSPYTTFEIHGADGRVAGPVPACLAIQCLVKHPQDALDLELLYIGQAFGKEGERTPVNRLVSHSTLQQILAKTLADSPDTDVLVVFAGLEPPSTVTHLMPVSVGESALDEQLQSMIRANTTPLTLQQRVNFTEAALIRYFQPLYNETFKGNFPDPLHISYRECYDLDLSGIVVELDSTGINLRFWSRAQSPQLRHTATFDLHEPSVRRSMFDFTGIFDDRAPPSHE